jgi:hypothetical protein
MIYFSMSLNDMSFTKAHAAAASHDDDTDTRVTCTSLPKISRSLPKLAALSYSTGINEACNVILTKV